MYNYKDLYIMLFNSITDALNEIAARNYKTAADILCHAQQKTEDIYIHGEFFEK